MAKITIIIDRDDDVHILDQSRRRRRPVHVRFGVPTLRNKFHPHERHQMAVKIPNDAIADIPLVFTDQEGHNLAGGTTNTSVTVADPTIANVAVSSDGQWVHVTPLMAAGASQITYQDADDNISCVIDFSIVTPAPISVAPNEAGMVLTPNPSPPAGAPGGPSGA